MLAVKAFIFALHLFSLGDVPLPYGYETYLSAERHNVPPEELGALLLAENRSRRYHPLTVGLAGKGGERGLFQLDPNSWTGFCGITKEELFDPFKNIDCAAKVVKEIKEEHKKNCRKKSKHIGEWLSDPDWRTHYRCAWGRKARNSVNCIKSVNRVLRKERLIKRSIKKGAFNIMFESAQDLHKLLKVQDDYEKRRRAKTL